MKTMMDVMRTGMVARRPPEEGVLCSVLHHLEEEGGWVDMLDLPFPPAFGRDARRALLRAFALEGTVELARHPVFPAVLAVRITDVGRRNLGPPSGIGRE